jgi:signal transduction histidine kinase
MLRALRYLAFALALAAAYFVAGKLGLLLAIPPGYATAVWPPSGIALGTLLVLGSRYWPGIWLGSFLLNFSSGPWMPAAVIAVGAALQALLGATLIRSFVGFPNALLREREIFWFLVLGGPVACVVNASAGVAALLMSGAILQDNMAYTWWTWWVGDTIGALIFAPLIVMWMGGQEWKLRRIAVTLSLAITFAASVLVFVYTSRLEWQQLERRFREDAVDLTRAIGRRLDLNIEMVRATGALFAASDTVERDEFQAFTDFMLSARADLQAIQWAPRVPATARKAFEETLRNSNSEHREIFEWRNRQVLLAAPRGEYFPIEFIEPHAANAPARGFDLASDPIRRSALEHARDTGEISATAPVELVQSLGPHDGLLIALPVYGKAMPAQPSIEERRRYLQGFAVAVIRTHRIVGLALADRPAAQRLRLQIADAGSSGKSALLFQTLLPHADTATASHLQLNHQATLNVAGRHWILTFNPNERYLTRQETLITWMVLAAGLCFCALVGAGALSLTGRTAVVEAQVRERTAELAETNERLAKADRVKSEFISTVSHELRTPLTSIRGSLGLLNGGAAGTVPDKARELLDIAYRNTDRLQRLINDILDVEKIDSGKLTFELAPQSLPALIEQAVESNAGYAQNCNVRFEVKRPLPQATVYVDAHRVLQVIANLLSNAAKFSPAGSAVEIFARVDEATARVYVKDQGPGIPPEFQSSIFQRFSQADGSDARAKGGTGLGLAISKALIERMGGNIDYATWPGAGTMFFFDLPLSV